MSNFNIEYSINFKSTDYIFYLSVNEIGLKIIIENANECMYWMGEFESKYLEEITNKAGSYKSFNVFIKMLMSALSKESDSVIIDLLSYRDVEQMRQKKSLNNSNNSMNDSSFQDTSKINKKYLIISYASEFEKVHYPLPLHFVSNPDSDIMMRTINRLRKVSKINSSSSNNVVTYKEIEEIKLENINLKNKIKLLESQRKQGAVDNDENFRSYNELREEYDNYKSQAEAKIKLLTNTLEDIKSNYSNNTVVGVNSNEKYIKLISDLESKLEKAEEILIKERKIGKNYIDEKNKDIEKIIKEMNYVKESEKKLKVRVNQLEKELEYSNKRNFYDMRSNTKLKNFSSNKSNCSNNNSIKSEVSKDSKSSLKKNLVVNPYNKFNLNSKNYSPFKFFKNKTNTKSTISNKSEKSNKTGKSGNTNLSKKSNYSSVSKYSKSSFNKNTNSKVTPKITNSNFVPKKNTSQNTYITGTIIKKEEKGSGRTKKEDNVIASKDISSALGRIQHLLKTAKV